MKEEFKKFVQKNPYLVDYVKNKKMSWQQFYEIYDLYGEDNSIWNSFKTIKSDTTNNSLINVIKDIFTQLRGIDLDSIQKTISSIDKAIDTFKGLSNNQNSNIDLGERPKYKYFED